MKLLSGVHLRNLFCVSLKKNEPRRGAAVSSHTEPHLGYRLPTGEQQTAENQDGEAWCRIFTNLFSGLESMPSNDRVLKSIYNVFPYEVVIRGAFADPYSRIAVTG